MTDEVTLEDILEQIAKNQEDMMQVIKTHDVMIKRLQIRLGRVEEP